MFGRNKRIKELKNENEELRKENNELRKENFTLSKKNQSLHMENTRLRISFEPFKPILENPKLKPAITPFCKLCDYRVMSGSNVTGCCKGSVCDDFTRKED